MASPGEKLSAKLTDEERRDLAKNAGIGVKKVQIYNISPFYFGAAYIARYRHSSSDSP